MSFSAATDPTLVIGAGVGVLLFALVYAWPRWGLRSRHRRRRQISARVAAEDALKHLYKAELNRQRPTLQSLAGAIQVRLSRASDVVADLLGRGLLAWAGEELKLTAEGRRCALHVIRAHRLWEKHLAEETGVAESYWHQQAEVQEHFLSPEQTDRLAARLGNPPYDPHGDPIPSPGGALLPRPGRPLVGLGVHQTARILHIEDEPEEVYARIMAAGLCPGMVVRLLEVGPDRVRLWANGSEHILAPMVAANLSVAPLAEEPAEEETRGQLLSQLRPGQRGRVRRILSRCRGAERRRFMDLGILPGTMVAAELRSPGGNLTAYRVREALIALRKEQSDLIQVDSVEEVTP